MKKSRVVILGCVALALTACSTVNQEKKAEYKTQGARVQPLEVPPDLTVPVSDSRYAIPGKEGEITATFSDYNKGQALQPATTTGVLSVAASVRLERNGAQRWLVVNDKAENVWSVSRSFWLERGFLLEQDDAAAGVIVTDWLENQANLPQTMVRSTLARLFDSLRPYGERDQFRMRLERSADGASTEIHISHHGIQESPASKSDKVTWLPRPNDPELENILLQQLMAKLTGAAPSVPQINAVQHSVKTVRLTQKDGHSLIVIEADFENSWRQVGLALDKARILVEDKNREGRLYFLNTAAPGKNPQHYQISLQTVNGVTEVSVQNENGKSDQEAARLTELLHRNLEALKNR